MLRRTQLHRSLVMASAVVALALVAAAAVAESPAEKPADSAFDQQLRPFLAKHCSECHSGEKPKGDLSLDKLAPDFNDADSRQHWLDVLDRVARGEMPPKEKKTRPSEQEIATVSTWITERVKLAEAAERAQGRVVLRRLNRIEYENTLSDLLGLKLNIKDELPQDGSANGFDNAGAALHTSSFLMERYLEAADTALDQAIANLPQPPLFDKRLYCQDQRHVKVTKEDVFRHLDDGLVFFCSSAWQAVHMNEFYPRDGGYYRFRISASAIQSDGNPVTYRVVAGRSSLMGKDGLIGYFDAPAGEPKVTEFVEYMEPKTTINILPYGLTNAQTVKAVGAKDWEGPGLVVHWVEVKGPLYDAWPPESHRRIFGDLKQAPAPIYNQSKRVEVVSDQPLVDAERILHDFTRRAFRRRVTDADVQPFVDVVEDRLDAGYSFEQAIRAALKGVLMAPDFLFLSEQPGPLDDFALASRLSYFLWSTMPDDELLALAEQDKLHEPEVLRDQVERMLKHAKAAAFTENFVGQWLSLRDIDATEPSHLLYPEFDHMLKVAMIREVELFFDELLKHDLSLTNFVASDFSMLNGRLAKHYGVEGPVGWEFQRTPLPPESHRGGLLTMAGVLKVTANGTTTSPVLRGAWVLDRILGTPPPPPPGDVPVLDPDIRGAVTIREQLAKHRSVPACAACHVKIDPPGFALESFDCIGGWRDEYRVTGSGRSVVIDGRRMSYHIGKPVDPTGETADGQKFENIDDLKQILLKDKDQIARGLATKILAYATGAAPTAADREQVDAIVDQIRQKDYGFRSLVHAVVQSKLFRNK